MWVGSRTLFVVAWMAVLMNRKGPFGASHPAHDGQGMKQGGRMNDAIPKRLLTPEVVANRFSVSLVTGGTCSLPASHRM
jgi:hypothetical protein